MINNTNLGSVLVGVSGQRLADADRELLLHPAVGGVVLFTRNIQSPQQVTVLAKEIRNLRNPRLLITVDQEGGRVQRLLDGFTRLPALSCLGKLFEHDSEQGLKMAYRHGWVMATEVLSASIDLSFAPVIDIDCGSHVIGDRAFHPDEKVVAALADRYLTGMHAAGMCATGKHFPGHGSVVEDSHTDDVFDHRSLEAIMAKDLQPFAKLAARLDAVMMAHVCYPAVDSKPAGYSNVWMQDVLNGELGFRGTVFSDDLDMQAACSAGIMHERVWSALDAGCDAVLICDPDSARMYLESLQESLPHSADRLVRLYGRAAASYEQLSQLESWQKWRTELEQQVAQNRD